MKRAAGEHAASRFLPDWCVVPNDKADMLKWRNQLKSYLYCSRDQYCRVCGKRLTGPEEAALFELIDHTYLPFHEHFFFNEMNCVLTCKGCIKIADPRSIAVDQYVYYGKEFLDWLNRFGSYIARILGKDT